jgi:hypothetical protein
LSVKQNLFPRGDRSHFSNKTFIDCLFQAWYHRIRRY